MSAPEEGTEGPGAEEVPEGRGLRPTEVRLLELLLGEDSSPPEEILP